MFHKIIDLTVPISNNTQGVKISLQNNLPVYLGQKCYAYDIDIKSHIGTYFETSSHVFRNGIDTDDVLVENLFLLGYCIRINTPEKCITYKELEESCHSLKHNSALLVDTCGDDKKYFSKDAAQWMVSHKIALMASNTKCYDTGFTNPTGFFIDLFKANIPIVANIVNLELLPQSGFYLVVMPLKVQNICTVPSRVIALV